MNKQIRLTGNPAKATQFRQVDRVRGPDRLEGELLHRAMPCTGDLDEAARTFQAIVATASPVPRRDARGQFLEILDAAGLENDPEEDTPLLTDHRASARETVGRATGFTVDGSAVHATLRLGLADDVEPIFQRVKDGTLRHVSAGYRVLEWREGRDEAGQRTKTATRWRILEISLVPIPADKNAIIQRSAEMPFDTPEARDSFVEEIRSLAGLSEEWVAALPDDADEDTIRANARQAMTQRSAPRIRVTRDHTDPAAIQTRAADALAFRMVGGNLPEPSREFVGMSLRELAADALQRSGISTRGMSADDIFARSLGQHTTSDFPLLVSNAMGKVAAQSYQAAESPLKALARQRTLPNFKTSTAVRIGEMGRLEEMTESGEFTHTTRAEAGETLHLKTFGRAINVSRKLLIDDDLGLLGDMTSAMGQAAAQTEAEELVALLTGNPRRLGTAKGGSQQLCAGGQGPLERNRRASHDYRQRQHAAWRRC